MALVEFEGKDTEEAINLAAGRLNVPPERLVFTIASTGHKGLFGFGAKKARILVDIENSAGWELRDPPPSPDDSPAEKTAVPSRAERDRGKTPSADPGKIPDKRGKPAGKAPEGKGLEAGGFEGKGFDGKASPRFSGAGGSFAPSVGTRTAPPATPPGRGISSGRTREAPKGEKRGDSARDAGAEAGVAAGPERPPDCRFDSRPDSRSDFRSDFRSDLGQDPGQDPGKDLCLKEDASGKEGPEKGKRADSGEGRGTRPLGKPKGPARGREPRGPRSREDFGDAKEGNVSGALREESPERSPTRRGPDKAAARKSSAPAVPQTAREGDPPLLPAMFEAQDRLFGSWKEEGFGPEDLGEYGILLSEGEKIILPKPITPFPRGKTTNVPLPPIGEKAPEVLKNIIGLMGFSAETESTAHEGRLVLTLVGGDSSLLIGRRGVGLDSLELLLNKIIREDRPGDAPEGFGEEFRNDGDDADDPNDPDDADLSDEREERDERDEADDPDEGEREESPRDPGERSDGETGEKEAGDGPGPLPFPTRPRIVVDAEDYRARRHLGILVKILAMASRAVTTGKPQGIPQLTNPERRVVRVVVKQLKLVGMTTQGTGALKNITIFSAKEK